MYRWMFWESHWLLRLMFVMLFIRGLMLAAEWVAWDRIWHRFHRMVARGIEPYPMVFDTRATDLERYRGLKAFQRWVVTGLYRAVPFEDYNVNIRKQPEFLEVQEILELEPQ